MLPIQNSKMNSGSSQDDPLKVQSAISNTNPTGRPPKTITFCPQRKSLVSKILHDIESVKEKSLTKSMIDTLSCENHFAHKEGTKFSEIRKHDTDETDLNYDNDFMTIPTDSRALKVGRCSAQGSRCKKKMNTKQTVNYKRTQKNHISRDIVVKCANNVEQQMTNNEDRKYSCDYPGCSYVSKIMSNLSKHKRIHTNERPYMCDQCTFRTNFVNSLKVHRRTHTSERPYCCDQCGHRSNSISNLKKHHLHRHQKASVNRLVYQ